MKILAFDTSNNTVSVAVSEGQNILAYLEELKPAMQAERLLPMIEKTLSNADLTYKDIDYLGVINGPGSFTGIRAGLAAAKGILLATNIKGASISNFNISFYRAKMQIKDYDKIVIFLNAYRNQLYTQIFYKNGTESKPALMESSEAVELIASATSEIIIYAGSGLEVIYEQIKIIKNITILPRFSRVKAFHICRYIDDSLPNYNSKIEPLYIRLPDAKIQKKTINKGL